MSRRTISDEKIVQMQIKRAEGFTAKEVAEMFGVSVDLAYKYTQVAKSGKGAAKIIRENKDLPVDKLAAMTGANRKYILGVLRYAKVDKETVKPNELKEYEEEVKKICKVREKEEIEKQKHYKKELAEEIKRLKERYSFVAK